MEAHYFQNDCFMRPGQLLAEAGKLAKIPGIIVQGRYDLLCPPATSHALSAVWPESEVRFVEGAGHSLYDPGIRDAVMKAIADMAQNYRLEDLPKCHWPEKAMLLTSMDIDPSDDAEFNRWYDREHLEERVAIPGFLEARRYIAHRGTRNISASIPPRRSTFWIVRPIAPHWPTRPIGRRQISRVSKT